MDNPLFHLNNPSNIIEESLTTRTLKNSEALEFHQQMEVYSPSPLIELKELAKEFGVKNIFLKDESFRFGLNAFKGLGASYAISKLLEKDPSIETFCTATDGNHGRGVAWAASLEKKTSRIFVPRDTTSSRIDAIESEGGIVERVNGNYEETSSYAQIMADGNGWTLVQDNAFQGYEEIPAQIMAGYLTQVKEMENELHTAPKPKIDFVFLQSGVGSWPAAVAWYYLTRYGNNRPKLIIIEPVEAAGFLQSLIANERISPKGSFKTMMAGLNCGIPSSTAWDILKNTIDAAMAIEDDHTVIAMKKLHFPSEGDRRIISGESGAAGFAGFAALMTDPRYKELKTSLNISEKSTILFFSTEGATDPDNFQDIMDRI